MELLHTDTLAEAREKLKTETENFMLRIHRIPCDEALGCVCAETVTARENVPSFRHSTVDGYAIIAKDSYGATDSNPAFYSVTGHVNIEERAAVSVMSGEAVQVQTGSMVPDEATAVLMVEYTETYSPNKIVGYKAVSEGENITQIGEDMKMGDCLIRSGRKINARDVAMMAAMGIGTVQVYEPLVLTVISTGDELVDMDEELSGAKVRDINSYGLAAQARSNGFIVRKQMRIKDQETAIRQAVEEALDESDVILLSGGSSKGNKDYTKKILEEITHNVFTHGISIKPGKPTILSYDRQHKTIIAGLPGHPMAAMLMFRLVILDWYETIAKIPKGYPYFAVMQENVSSNQGREMCLLVRLVCGEEDYTAVPVYAKSGSISALERADGYVMIPRNKEGLKKGERVRVEVFE